MRVAAHNRPDRPERRPAPRSSGKSRVSTRTTCQPSRGFRGRTGHPRPCPAAARQGAERIKCPDVFVGQTLRRPQVRWCSVRRGCRYGQWSPSLSAFPEPGGLGRRGRGDPAPRPVGPAAMSPVTTISALVTSGWPTHRAANPNVRYDRNPLQHQSVLALVGRRPSSVGE
jgi:hypothetical protein